MIGRIKAVILFILSIHVNFFDAPHTRSLSLVALTEKRRARSQFRERALRFLTFAFTRQGRGGVAPGGTIHSWSEPVVRCPPSSTTTREALMPRVVTRYSFARSPRC